MAYNEKQFKLVQEYIESERSGIPSMLESKEIIKEIHKKTKPEGYRYKEFLREVEEEALSFILNNGSYRAKFCILVMEVAEKFRELGYEVSYEDGHVNIGIK